MVSPTLLLDTSSFTLCTSGVAGLVGGDEAVLAMAAVHVYEHRPGLGWYNSPGSYQIAKRLALLAKSRIPDGYSPGVHTDPTKLVELDITKGPKFRAAQSGTVIEDTGHVASLVMKECSVQQGKPVGGRKTEVVEVMIVRLDQIPTTRMCPGRINSYNPISASIPISISISGCVACGVLEDWYAFSLILLGILANGIASLVIGSGELQFAHPEPAKGSPRGDGILVSGGEIVLLIGEESAVNSITRGSFSLKFPDEVAFGRIGWCSVLLTIQFFAQLLLIPQASLFGQILFITSLGVSWIYNSWLTSLWHEDKIQRHILFKSVLENPTLDKYTLGTFTSAVVFSLLVLQPKEPTKFLDGLLPDTNVWRQWKQTIVQQLDQKKSQFTVPDGKPDGFDGEELKLLEKLYDDARVAYSAYDKSGYATFN